MKGIRSMVLVFCALCLAGVHAEGIRVEDGEKKAAGRTGTLELLRD